MWARFELNIFIPLKQALDMIIFKIYIIVF